MRREELAAQSRTSYDYIRRLESEDPPNPTLGRARAIADVLGFTVDYVFPPSAPSDSAAEALVLHHQE